MNEANMEKLLIEQLIDLKYEHRPDIRDKATLDKNFREKFNALNGVTLTDTEFKRLLEEIVTDDVFAASTRLRERNTFFREDGTPLTYTLVNTKDWCRNTFEVVSQIRINTENSHHRYDVMLLINGVPVVQIELKTLGLNPKKAIEQIVEYKNDPGNGYGRTLLAFVQLFVVSNRTETFFFANNNARHFTFNADERFLPVYKHADPDNRKVDHLEEFTEKFLGKCALGQMISRFMVLVASEQKLLAMRPYQIYAVRAIEECVAQNNGNGYIWHTTGSGKTLTSFKASTLLKARPEIEKVLFVVDRNDLDRQTREEFNRFQEGCVEENTNTGNLVRRLLSSDYKDKVIVTTIQKLGLALSGQTKADYKKRLEPLSRQRLVIIFDECHRSQFGENHQAIKEFFPKAQLFGFTGTPIFEGNARTVKVTGEEAVMQTTAEVFQRELHNYTITHAIEDKNVLKFHVDYFQPAGEGAQIGTTAAKQRIVERILETHDAATGERRFNAILATGSIPHAIEYEKLFARIQAERAQADPEFRPLTVGVVFSPPASVSPDIKQVQDDLLQEAEDYRTDPEGKARELRRIIEEYNARFETNFRIEEFDDYYKDVQKRIKDQQYPNADMPRKGREKIDITIVVDMLLTGFDSKYLNTLYVDKNLKHHGLIQAFSRTNRVLNHTKPFGHIHDFRGQETAVDAAIEMFSGVAGDRARQIWLVDSAPKVIEKFREAVQELQEFMAAHGLPAKPEEVVNLKGDEAKAEFVQKFKEVQRFRTQLDQYTDISEEGKQEIEALLPKNDLQSFRGAYITTAQNLKESQGMAGGEGDGKPSETMENLDFEFVLFSSAVIDYDYIMGLIASSTGQGGKPDRMSRDQLIRLIESDSKFADDREMIVAYVRSLPEREALDEKQVRDGYVAFKAARESAEVADIAARHRLDPDTLGAFVAAILRDKVFHADRLTDLFAPLGLGWKPRVEAELALMEELEPLLKRRAGWREIAGLKAYE